MGTEKVISVDNLGPIEHGVFKLKGYGVTVFTAPNGSGKSILLEAVQAAARGKGKLPLRDHAKRGKVEAFGAVITIGGTCRHTGEFEVTHIEGRFDLASLVDPRLKDPAAADRARIKALVALTGVEASANLFRGHEAFTDFDTVVPGEALATTDLVEMASRIKAKYDAAALSAEKLAEREDGQATGLIPSSDVDLESESDAKVLQAAYNEARDELTRLESQAKNAHESRKRAEEAQGVLDRLGEESLRQQLDNLKQAVEEAPGHLAALQAEGEALKEEMRAIELKIVSIKEKWLSAKRAMDSDIQSVKTVESQLELVADAKKILQSEAASAPEQADIDAARAEMDAAAAAIEMGIKVRGALENANKSKEHRRRAAEARDRAGRYRDAGKATDEVLSGSIKCERLRVESDGESARLMTNHPIRGPRTLYHELSEGEKWTIAVDIGADTIGEGGLLVIDQIGWEGIDGSNKLHVHHKGCERKVYILAAAASDDPEAPREIVATTLGIPDGPEQPQQAHQEPEAPAKAPAPEPKPAAKPEAKPKAAKKAPPAFNEGDEIPF